MAGKWPGSRVAFPDLTASLVRITEGATDVTLTARIGNGGATVVFPGAPVSFYDGDPRAGGVLLGTVTTSLSLQPGVYEDVSLVLPFGTATRARSEALLRLELPDGAGLLAFGAHDPDRFGPEQGVDLLTFFASVVQRLISRHLDASIAPVAE